MSLVKVIASGLVYIASREAPSCLPLRLASPRLAFAFALPRPNKGGRSFENPAYLSFSLSHPSILVRFPRFLLVAVPCSCVPLRLVLSWMQLEDGMLNRSNHVLRGPSVLLGFEAVCDLIVFFRLRRERERERVINGWLLRNNLLLLE